MLRVNKTTAVTFRWKSEFLSEVRGPASVAQTLYRETEASRELRLKVAAERKAMKQFEELPAGRPSKNAIDEKSSSSGGEPDRRPMRANPEVISGGSNRTSGSATIRPRTDRAGYRFRIRQRRSAFLRMLFSRQDKSLLLLPLGSWEVIPPEKTIIPSCPELV